MSTTCLVPARAGLGRRVEVPERRLDEGVHAVPVTNTGDGTQAASRITTSSRQGAGGSVRINARTVMVNGGVIGTPADCLATAGLKIVSRSNSRYRGAGSKGNASRSC